MRYDVSFSIVTNLKPEEIRELLKKTFAHDEITSIVIRYEEGER